MFSALPPRYDLTNHVITLGLDRGWREAAAKACLETSPHKVLDLACGTGDLSVAICRFAGYEVDLVGLDYSQPMLDIACKKVAKVPGGKATFILGDAANLPFADDDFDCVGISFAFRNLTYKNPLSEPALAQILRVLKPGGRFVVVETSQPRSKIIRRGFHIYLRSFVRTSGFLISGNQGAYRYLAESAAHFYTPDDVKALLMKSGFKSDSYRPMLFGAVGIHVAVK